MIGEFLEFLGISFGFPFFDFQPLKAWHSLHLGTERYMIKLGGATFSCMRPTSEPNPVPQLNNTKLKRSGMTMTMSMGNSLLKVPKLSN